LLFWPAYSAPQSVPVPDFHAIGFPAASFGEDDDVRVLIETTTEATTTTTSTTTEIPTTTFIELPPAPVTEPPPPPSPAGYDIPSPSSNFVPATPDPPPSDTTELPPPPPVEVEPPPPPPAATVAPVPDLLLPAPPPEDVDSEVPDVLFLVDASGSMKYAWENHLQCVSTIARPAIGRAKIGVILYSSKYKHRLHIPFANYNDAATLDSMINALPFHGGVTCTGAALDEAIRVLEKERPRRVAVITLTDGYSWDPLDRSSDRIRTFAGATTYAVALEEFVVRRELQILAGDADRVFTEEDACDRLASIVASGSDLRKNTIDHVHPEPTTPSPWNPESTSTPSSLIIGNENEAHAQFEDRMFVVDRTTSDDSFARFEDNFLLNSKKSSYILGPQQNYLPIPRRGANRCSLDVVFAFDSTSHAGLPALQAAAQKLLQSSVFKRRSVRVGAVKFSDGLDSRIIFPLDDASVVPLDSVLNDDGHRGVEKALHLAAELFKEARQTSLTKRTVIVISDAFDGASAERALDELQS
ncbi:hypothetical protein PMAYCL1PPCAC_32607, partial [Pristionchus mayeri]